MADKYDLPLVEQLHALCKLIDSQWIFSPLNKAWELEIKQCINFDKHPQFLDMGVRFVYMEFLEQLVQFETKGTSMSEMLVIADTQAGENHRIYTEWYGAMETAETEEAAALKVQKKQGRRLRQKKHKAKAKSHTHLDNAYSVAPTGGTHETGSTADYELKKEYTLDASPICDDTVSADGAVTVKGKMSRRSMKKAKITALAAEVNSYACLFLFCFLLAGWYFLIIY
jgi:hypothetical protein